MLAFSPDKLGLGYHLRRGGRFTSASVLDEDNRSQITAKPMRARQVSRTGMKGEILCASLHIKPRCRGLAGGACSWVN